MTPDNNYMYLSTDINHMPGIIKAKLLSDENNIPDIQWQVSYVYGF